MNGLKYTAKVKRPDGSARNSFPSGHAAVACMGAEFLWQEYKDVSIWYGIAGYTKKLSFGKNKTNIAFAPSYNGAQAELSFTIGL